MFQKLKNMWTAFLNGLKMAKEAFKGEKIDTKSQDYTDISQFNPLAIASNTISNLACTEATFEIISESTQADRLKELCKDIETHRFEISESMLGQGDYYVLPFFDDKGILGHSYLDSNRVKIVAENEVNFVLDYYQNKNATRTYFLMRNHKMENDALSVSYSVVNEAGKADNIGYEPWNNLVGTETRYTGDNINMGYGRYKCPTSSRGLSTVYGVPMNFGCGTLEKDIFETLNQIKDEFKYSEITVFADENLLQLDDKAKAVKKTGNLYPIRQKMGMDNLMTIFNPSIRESSFYTKLENQLKELESQMGLNSGILTENQAMQTATATAVKRANSNTIAYINAVHNALDNGNKMTLEADAMYLNILPDLWQYNSDYIDPFVDMAEQFGYLMQGHNAGAVETSDVTKWIYPQMSEEEVQEKLQRINDTKTNNTANAIYASLTQ